MVVSALVVDPDELETATIAHAEHLVALASSTEKAGHLFVVTVLEEELEKRRSTVTHDTHRPDSYSACLSAW